MPAPPLHTVNLNLLVALDALLATGSVRRTAERLGVTQSAMSHSLRQLRALLDDPLFVRAGNRLLPTPRAEELAGPLRQTLASLEHLIAGGAGFSFAGSHRRFVIAATDPFAVAFVPALVEDVARRSPGVEIVLSRLDLGRIETQLATGEVDLAIGVIRPGTGLALESLFHADFAVLAREGHPKIGRELDLDTFCALPHVRVSISMKGSSFVDEALARIGRTRRVSVRTSQLLTALALVARTDLLTTLPCVTTRHAVGLYLLVAHPPPIELPAWPIGMAWHERFTHEPGLLWLKDRVRAAAAMHERLPFDP